MPIFGCINCLTFLPAINSNYNKKKQINNSNNYYKFNDVAVITILGYV